MSDHTTMPTHHPSEDQLPEWQPKFLAPGDYPTTNGTEEEGWEEELPNQVNIRTPPAEIAASLNRWEEFRRQAVKKKFSEESLRYGVEKVFSTGQAAAFFGRSAQWIYWGLRDKDKKGNPITPVFTYKDGSPILPRRVGKNKKRQFTLPLLREIAFSHFRRGDLTEEELEHIMARILIAEFGEEAFSK